MRKWLAVLVLGVLAAAPAATAGRLDNKDASIIWLDPAAGAKVGPGVSAPPITSANVTYHGTIPIDSPGVGGEVVNHKNGKKYFYATGLKGLSIYDVADPSLPMLVGYLPFYHAQNEDLKVSEDGTRAVISADGGLLVTLPGAARGIYVVDTTDPTKPVILGSHSDSNHTSACADAKCEWIYGSSTGAIYDARNPATIIKGRQWNLDAAGAEVGGRHALNRDESGLMISDSNPRLVLDPRTDPANPVLVAQGSRVPSADSRLQHNNRRPNAAEWVARDMADPADAIETVTVQRPARVISVTNQRPVMRPGEIFIGNAESNINPTCSSAGGLSTWSMVNFDKGAALQQLEVFRPLNGTGADGSPAVNALGCSGHWFTENDGYVAGSWYEHGVRFFDVDLQTGTIDEVGYFQPVATEAGAAYWVDDEFVYSVDYARGIDILSFDRGAQEPTRKELKASWLANLEASGGLASAERYFCRLGAQN